MAEIIKAKTAGFCFGVDRAVNMIYELLDSGKSVTTLGPIIHNPQVIEDFERRGVKIADTPEQVDKNSVLVIRTHGITKDVFERINSLGIEYIDATCPFVKKIHKIADENSQDGCATVIAGDPLHPEVQGIMSYCNAESYVVGNAEELENLFKKHPDLTKKCVVFVSQTTFSVKEWEKNLKKIKILCTNPKIFDTICCATEERQEEANELSLKCDAMIVVGGRHSSNTQKLRSVCEKNSVTFLVETANELYGYNFAGFGLIGVTAGASTPAGIIKEVLETMSEIVNETPNMIEEEKVQNSVSAEEFNFDAALEESLNNYGNEKVVTGVVLNITPTEIQVDIGRKQTGYVPFDEYSADPNADPRKELHVGDELKLVIMKTNDQEGTVMLSKRIFEAASIWEDLSAAVDSGEIFEGKVTDVIKKGEPAAIMGLIVLLKGIRVFIPAPLASESRGTDLEALNGTVVSFKLIEVDKSRKRAKGSVKAVLREARKVAAESFWQTAEVGQVIEGTVKSITSFGVFVDLGGVDGLIYNNELTWDNSKKASDIVKIGDSIEVRIKSLDPEAKRVSLGYKKEDDSPWKILERDYPVGSVVDVKIVGFTDFGAFAQILPSIDGLIYISQISNRRIEKPSDELKIGETVTVKIIGIDFEKRRINLSIRALLPEVAEEEAPAEEAASTEEAAE